MIDILWVLGLDGRGGVVNKKLLSVQGRVVGLSWIVISFDLVVNKRHFKQLESLGCEDCGGKAFEHSILSCFPLLLSYSFARLRLQRVCSL